MYVELFYFKYIRELSRFRPTHLLIVRLLFLLFWDLRHTFENIEYIMMTNTSSIRLIVIYRPPPAQKNCLTVAEFFEEWTSFVITPGKFIIMGDIYFHIDDRSDCNASRIRSSIESTCLIMHVREPTHRKGRTLDVLLSRENDEQLVRNIIVTYFGVLTISPLRLQLTSSGPDVARRKCHLGSCMRSTLTTSNMI